MAVTKAKDATVFIVDDDRAIRKSLRWLLESVGLRVRAFSSARTFLAAYDPEAPGCLVLDVRMPGMSGLELQEQLREQGIEVPVIVLTGYGDVPMAVRAMKAGALDFLEKPVSDQILLDHIQRALARGRVAPSTGASRSGSTGCRPESGKCWRG